MPERAAYLSDGTLKRREQAILEVLARGVELLDVEDRNVSEMRHRLVGQIILLSKLLLTPMPCRPLSREKTN